MGGQSNDRGYNGRMGMGGMPRGGPRGYGQQPLPPHDGYDHSAVGDRQGPMSARLVNNNLNVAASNLPSNSGRSYPFLLHTLLSKHQKPFSLYYIICSNKTNTDFSLMPRIL